MASVYKFERDAEISTAGPGGAEFRFSFDAKGLYSTDDVTAQMILDGFVSDSSHPLKLAKESG